MNTDKTTVTGEGNALRIPQGRTYRTLIENGEETDLLCRKCECLYWQCEHQNEIEKEYDTLKNAPRTFAQCNLCGATATLTTVESQSAWLAAHDCGGNSMREQAENTFANDYEPDHDDTVHCCPECETPNQFGELCHRCISEHQSEE